MIERIHLHILREIKQKGSLTAAAMTLNLTQSALSHAIRKLEDRIGTKLWRKEGRSLKMTEAGNMLLNLANRVIPQIEFSEEQLRQYAGGELGTLRIGMECHPCFQWLQKSLTPYLQSWPKIDIDVKQKFQFGGLAALFNYDIDMLITPDPLHKEHISYVPVFPYEQVLIVHSGHRLASHNYLTAEDLSDQTVLSYPVEPQRLDLYAMFLTPESVSPKKHKMIEATEIIFKLVEAGRGVAALPDWLVSEHQEKLSIVPLRLGKHGIQKSIHIGTRSGDQSIPYIKAFIELAKKTKPKLSAETDC